MQQPVAIQYPISDILEWDASGKLVIAPKFQRRSIWSPKAKSYLIDTIIRTMPIPPIFVRQRIDPINRKMIREVIDGQQRLRAVLEFIKGEYQILKSHNVDYGGMYYTNLPDDMSKAFLGYKFVINVFEDISDQEVLDIFARINTYTIRLNNQELRNAEFFGQFKQTIYSLALQHYSFWINYKILNDSQIARMEEAELVSELVISMLNGIQQTKASDIRKFYELYDDEFPQKEVIEKQFPEVINIIGDILQGTLSSSEFLRIPLFFSLFLFIQDAKYGLPNSSKPRLRLSSGEIRRIAGKLKELDAAIKSKDMTDDLAKFFEFTRLSTADVGKRLYRHEFLWNNITAQT